MKQKTPTRIRKLAPISKVSPAADSVINPNNGLNGGGGSARRKKRLTKTRQKSKSTAVLSKIVDSRQVAFSWLYFAFSIYRVFHLHVVPFGRKLAFIGVTVLL